MGREPVNPLTSLSFFPTSTQHGWEAALFTQTEFQYLDVGFASSETSGLSS